MDLNEFGKSLRVLWEKQPTAVVLLIAGVIVFLFVVVDAWYHKRHRKKRH